MTKVILITVLLIVLVLINSNNTKEKFASSSITTTTTQKPVNKNYCYAKICAGDKCLKPGNDGFFYFDKEDNKTDVLFITPYDKNTKQNKLLKYNDNTVYINMSTDGTYSFTTNILDGNISPVYYNSIPNVEYIRYYSCGGKCIVYGITKNSYFSSHRLNYLKDKLVYEERSEYPGPNNTKGYYWKSGDSNHLSIKFQEA